MRVSGGKIIIDKKDLNRKVVVIKNYNSEVELQSAQFSSMQAIPGCIAIPESSFERYNKFRVKNKRKRLSLLDVIVVDVREEEQQHNFEKISEKHKASKDDGNK